MQSFGHLRQGQPLFQSSQYLGAPVRHVGNLTREEPRIVERRQVSLQILRILAPHQCESKQTKVQLVGSLCICHARGIIPRTTVRSSIGTSHLQQQSACMVKKTQATSLPLTNSDDSDEKSARLNSPCVSIRSPLPAWELRIQPTRAAGSQSSQPQPGQAAIRASARTRSGAGREARACVF